MQLHSLSVRDTAYARLHAQCARRFPDIARDLPKPEYRRDSPVVSYSYQATPALPPLTAQQWPYQTAPALPLPTAQPWPIFHSASVPALTQASALPPPPIIASAADSFYCPHPCTFCMYMGHLIHDCAQVGEYLRAGQATHINSKIYLPNGQPIPNDGTQHGLKVAIDTWWAAQSPSAPAPAPALALAPAQACVIFTWESPPHTDMCSAMTNWIKKILEVSQVINIAKEELEFPHNLYEIFATEKKKHKSKASKAPKLVMPPQHIKPHNNNSSSSQLGPQFHYQPTAEDKCLVSEL
jgi:hypothetical protein